MIDGTHIRHMARSSRKFSHNGCGTCVKNSASSGNPLLCARPSLPRLKLHLSQCLSSHLLNRLSALRNGRVQRVVEVLGDKILFLNLTARFAARREQYFMRRNGVSNTMERFGCSTQPGSPIVVRVLCEIGVKDMVPLPRSPVALAPSCILGLSQRLKSIPLPFPICLLTIRSSGMIGRAASHAGHGCAGSEATWSQ